MNISKLLLSDGPTVGEQRAAMEKRIAERRAQREAGTITCRQCGAEMPNDAYAQIFGRCAKHADEKKGETEQ